MNRMILLAGLACACVGCEMPGAEGDANTTITSEGDVVIVNNSDGTAEVVTKPTEISEVAE